MSIPALLPVKLLASELSISLRALNWRIFAQRAGSDLLPPLVKVGRRYYYKQEDLESWIDSKRAS